MSNGRTFAIGREEARLSMGATLSLLALLAIAAPAEAADPVGAARPDVELKIATLAPEGTTGLSILHEMDQEIRLKTGGKVGLKLYPGGIMGEEKAVLSKIKLGQLHGGAFTGMALGDILPAYRVLDIPFLCQNYPEADAAAEAVHDELVRMLEGAGWIELGRTDVGLIYLLSTHPIAGLDDLRKSRLVMLMGDPAVQVVIDVANLRPILLNVTDVLTSLATGTIDTVYVPPAYAIAPQWSTKTKYIVDRPFSNATGATIVKKTQFEKIPADLRPVVLEIARRHCARVAPATRKDEAEALAQMTKQGIKTTRIGDAQIKELQDLCTKVSERLPAALYPGDPANQEKMRALISLAAKAVEETRARQAPGAAAARAATGAASQP